jgi:Endonuclease/Exonuclease/phosphatase family
MKKGILVLLVFLTCFTIWAQENNTGKKQPQYISAIIGFYNLENLFDTLNDPLTDDAEFLPGSAKKYNTERYLNKLSNMAEVISGVGTDVNTDGLALFGVVEIENETVLKDLAATPKLKDRNYQVVHFNSPDARGIDVALVYNPKYFTVINAWPHRVQLPDKYPTRDILAVQGDFVGDTIVVLVNHWPSRRGGSNNFDLSNKEYAYNRNNTWRERQNQIELNTNQGLRTDGEEASRPNRMAAAKECLNIIDSLQAVNPHIKVVIMGDLNDDPTSPSVDKVLKAKTDLAQVQPKEIYNPFAQFHKQGYGTLAYNGKWNLFDQVMFTHPWLNQQQTNGWFLYKSHIYYRDFLIQKEGQYKGYPKRSWSGDVWINGYSDHLPVYNVLVRALPE